MKRFSIARIVAAAAAYAVTTLLFTNVVALSRPSNAALEARKGSPVTQPAPTQVAKPVEPQHRLPKRA